MNLNQYYTKSEFSDLLVSNLSLEAPYRAVDLGFGAGDLLYAAKRRWNTLDLIGIDIDPRNVQEANLKKSINAIHHDGFCPHLPDLITEKYGTIDLLISNPPYYSRELDLDIIKILKSVGFDSFISTNVKTIPAELVFLAQNIRLLNENSELAIILPAGLISGERWASLRSHLLEKFHIKRIIQLPSGSFKNTEAQAFILILKMRSKDKNNLVELSHVYKNYSIFISKDEAIQRSDYEFYSSQTSNPIKQKVENIEFSIFRGKTSYAELKRTEYNFIHTTGLTNTPSEISFDNKTCLSQVVTKPRDILIARVGRRCLGRIARVTSGQAIVSDCIIVVRPDNEESASKIWHKLTRPDTKDLLYKRSLGVGAKYLTQKIIKEFLNDVRSTD
ncbi:type I restriction enzyme M protein [Rheinheimera pacifica]|jgi:type I restriction-modification system DNA methylase subunit|uniref:site-specific DNA-methyltransferase (adenine-specific) n=1 Tax=Rheinheimera pacifica TaxID=173990 RepID=A0A1H6JXH0_9GAMM|nr:N-6 DNA methylase [Rheinheimera pacifica]SEH64712.1 type I restriction enzyme M protein [Rheinheimera pacifica]